MEPRDRLLAKLPPLLDGYEAICQAIALGDVDHAWHLSRELYKSAAASYRILSWDGL
jgi:DNA-binding FadR family transcriptional regulator